MSPPNSYDEKPVKSKRGRKALAVSEGHIDVTGKTHIMTVRRSNPPAPKKKTTTPKTTKQNNNNNNNTNNNNNYCRRCEQNDEYIDVLNDRIGKLESLVEKLTNATKHNNTIQPQQMVPQTINFSSVGTDDLINISNQIGVVLYERYEMQNIQNIQNQMHLQTFTPMLSPMTPMTPIAITPPVSPFTGCETTDITVPDWAVLNPFTHY